LKKIECVTRAFRNQTLIGLMVEHRDRLQGLWWHEVQALTAEDVVVRTSGTQFASPMNPMAHTSILVADEDLEATLELVQSVFASGIHEDEHILTATVSDTVLAGVAQLTT